MYARLFPLVLLISFVLGACSGSDSDNDCSSGQERCGGKCVAVASDPDNCGACGNACAGTELCSEGACVPDCADGQSACGRSCVDLGADPRHCGSCETDCTALPNVESATCESGACQPTCEEGWGDCDGDPSNGCETDLTSEGDHCGACGSACRDDQICGAGACGCPDEQQECNGVCADHQTNAQHCGGCGNDCTALAGVDSATCVAGACSLTCAPGFAQCGDDPSAGCETNTDTSSEHCGDCDRPCRDDQACDEGACICAGGKTDCDGDCVDTQTDALNCGTCGKRCEVGELCSEGSCKLDCAADETACGDSCVKTDFDSAHCGTCFNACPAHLQCVFGDCVCPGGQELCDGACVDTTSDPLHCGTCTNACAEGAECVSEACMCGQGEKVCDNKCEDIQNDPDHCGECNEKCDGLCSNGVCFVGKAEQISLRSGHACALLDDGTVRCWGSNVHGQIGNTVSGSGAMSRRPVAVIQNPANPDDPNAVLKDITKIFLGSPNTSAPTATNHGQISCAIDKNDRQWCWGSNETFQQRLGTTDSASKQIAYAVHSNLQTLAGTIIGVAPGNWTNCSLFDDGKAKCWGNNFNGAVGNGFTASGQTAPSYVADPESPDLKAPVPLEGITHIYSGLAMGCAVLKDGTARCWGQASGNKLGNPATINTGMPVIVVDPADATNRTALAGIDTLSVGGKGGCALMTNKTTRCWGGLTASLGDGTTTSSYRPIEVKNAAGTAAMTNVTHVSAGSDHICLVSDGQAYCWGAGASGRLGNGTIDNKTLPTLVRNADDTGAMKDVVQIEAGYQSTCLLRDDGTVYCFGSNAFGELGDGSEDTSSNLPRQVTFFPHPYTP